MSWKETHLSLWGLTADNANQSKTEAMRLRSCLQCKRQDCVEDINKICCTKASQETWRSLDQPRLFLELAAKLSSRGGRTIIITVHLQSGRNGILARWTHLLSESLQKVNFHRPNDLRLWETRFCGCMKTKLNWLASILCVMSARPSGNFFHFRTGSLELSQSDHQVLDHLNIQAPCPLSVQSVAMPSWPTPRQAPPPQTSCI